jgi:hypothetical protein
VVLDVLRQLPGVLRRTPDATFAIAVGLLLTALTLEAGGGLQLSHTTGVEMALQGAGAVLGALAILLSGDKIARAGLPALTCFALLAGLTLLSIIWAVEPNEAWLETSRTLSYLATFACGLSLVRLMPQRWSGLIGAIVLACTIVSVYALATKVFPGTLAQDETYARLRQPFGYWNAVGLMAALGVPGCLWLGARRSGHAAINALAYPICGLLLVAILFAYSRGSLLAAAVGCAFWFCAVPLRLRGVAVLATSAAGAIPVALWAFAQDGLTTDKAPLDLRSGAGHQLGVALVFMTLVLLAAGLAIGFAAARQAPAAQTRRAAGALIIVTLALVPVAGAIALSLSQRGLGGSISKGWNELTDPHASIGAGGANRPDRLTAVGSARARYYNDALKIARAHKLLGVGAGGYGVARLRFREDDLDVRHAHGYLFQTIADLGAAGLLLTLALLAAWLAAAGRATGMVVRRNRMSRPGFWDFPFGPERIGLLSLLAIVVVYGVHSLVDWTWFIPGPTVIALLAAAWVAGRGGRATWSAWITDVHTPPTAPLRQRLRASIKRPERAGIAAALVAIALVVMWSTWQPLRAVHAGDTALELVPAHIDQARADAQRAHRIDPLSIEPLTDLAVIEGAAGRKDAERAALEQAVQLQPRNPTAWVQLAQFELDQGDANAAQRALGPALYLDPRSAIGVTLFLDAQRQLAGTPAPPTTP